MDVPGWFTFKLTGEWIQNINAATHRMRYDCDNGGWSVDLYEEVDAGDVFDKLPTVVNDLGVLVGGLLGSTAEVFGLIPGAPVVQGGDDAWYGQIDLNVLCPGKMLLMTGPSHVTFGQSPNPVSGPGFFGGYTGGVALGQYTVETSLVSPGSAPKQFKDNFYPNTSLAVEQTSLNAYDILNQRSVDIPISCDDLVINKFFQGNRTPYFGSKTRGAFTGFSLAHSRGHMHRAVQEAVCYGVEASLCKLREVGSEIQEFVTYGGTTKSRMWAQMHSDVIGVPITLAEVGDAVILGSCILTTAGVGLYGSVQKATDAMVHECGCVEPGVERHEQYKFHIDQYCKQSPLVQSLICETADHIVAGHATVK